MSRLFEELARANTPIGEISLRRRLEPELQVDVWEVQLGDEFLMSSLFTTGERALAELGLAQVDGDELDVLVGGLGLGYTAVQALADDRVRSVAVVDALAEVIDWHVRGLVPIGTELATDPRCELVHGNFFELAAARMPLPARPNRYDAILVDIDHSPRHLLHPDNAGFYTADGLERLAGELRPGGVFALWSNDPTDDEFVAVLREVFAAAEAKIVSFPNFYSGREAESTIYVATV